MLHAAVFADCQAFASGLQIFNADIFLLSRFKALGSSLVRRGHGAVALNVLLCLLVRMLGLRQGRKARKGQGGDCLKREFVGGVHTGHVLD